MDYVELKEQQTIFKNLIVCRDNAKLNGLLILAETFQNEIERLQKVFSLQYKALKLGDEIIKIFGTDEKTKDLKQYKIDCLKNLSFQLKNLGA